MNRNQFIQRDEFAWEIPMQGDMRVPGMVFGDAALIDEMDEKVREQVMNVAQLPGIVQASYAMPDAHWGYGFPIGGVAAFDADQGGVVSAGGVGFDISCGVRTLVSPLTRQDVEKHQQSLADLLQYLIPAGVGSTGQVRLDSRQMNGMLKGGAKWAVNAGYGWPEDLQRIEEKGCMPGADPGAVSERAKKRQRDEMGTLGSGNHYLEVQIVKEIYDDETADRFGLFLDQVVVSIHCGSRGMGHQIGTEFLKQMVIEASRYGIHLPDRELGCAPIRSELGQSYLGAMRAAINCAFANRQILTHLTRQGFANLFPATPLKLLYDVSHNTCKVETHEIEGVKKQLYVHRKGATRAFGPGHPELSGEFSKTGQPVLIGGTMGTCSYILAGNAVSEKQSMSSACHGAGRSMSRRAATKKWHGSAVIDELAQQGVIIRAPSMRGVAEEAPHAYKDVTAVVDATQGAGLARKIAKLSPLICIKG